tara:strand:- start:41 stop:865 length:825 start_codon:yes stop_codon:yes gene_type:complete
MVLYLLLTISQAWSLPPCEGDESNWQNCEGSLTSDSGQIYTGVFKDGIFEGKNEKDTKYVGEFKDGSFNGQGTMTWGKGQWEDDIYVGEFKDGSFNGQGTYTFGDGEVHVGQFTEDGCPNCKIYPPGQYTDDMKKSMEIEQANDNIRIALDALNYTFYGNKKERKAIVLDADNCIFEKERLLGGSYDKLYLNNVIIDTIKFSSKRYYNEMLEQWMDAILISFSGDEKVFYHGVFKSENNEYEDIVSDSADLERVRKAWGVIYSRACKGASAGEF